MAKLILLSIVLVSMAVPIQLAARPGGRRALRRTQWIIVAYALIWAFMCLVWYPALVPLE
jgi:hypothetical protein